MEKGSSNDFGKGSIPRLIMKQALPLSVSQLVLLLYNIVDRIYIGRINGTDMMPLAGLGLTLPVVSIINAFTLLFGQGGAPHFSIARGEQNIYKARRILSNSCILLIIASVILTIMGFATMRPLLYALGASDSSIVYAVDYLTIYFAGIVFTMIGTGLNFYISAEGFPKISMFTVMAGTILNILLDPVFIFTFKLGIKGAAIATVISQFVSCVLVILFLTSSKAIIKLDLRGAKLQGDICKLIISMGFTGFIMEVTNSATQIVCNRTLKQYGGSDSDLYITIMTIVNSVRAIMNVAVTGITTGAQPVTGFNYGARKYDRVLESIRATSLFSFAYTGFAWLVVFLFPKFFIGLFCKDVSIINFATTYLHMFFAAYVFMSLQHSGQSTFMALGFSKRAIFFSMLRKVIIVIPLTLWLPMVLSDSISGVFIAEPISNVLGGAASFFTMYFTVYRVLKRDLKTNVENTVS